MKKAKIFLVAVLALSMFLFAGCGGAGSGKSPEESVKTAVSNFSKVSTFSAKAVIGATGEFEQNNEKEQFVTNLILNSKFDRKNKQDLKMDASVVGDVTYENKKYDGEISIKTLNKNLYFNLLKYPESIKDDPQLAPITALANKWFYLPSSQFQDKSPIVFDRSSMTPEQQQMMDEFDKISFLKNLKYDGTDKINETEIYKFKGVVDNDKIYNFLLKSSEINKQTPSDEDKADLRKSLEGLNVPMTVFVSVKDEIFAGMKGTINYKDAETKENAKVDFDLQITDFNNPVVVEVPKDATDFMKVLGVGSSAVPAPKVPVAK